MESLSECYSCTFSEEDERNAKIQSNKRNNYSQYNNFDNNAETRWIGILGEYALRSYLYEWGVPYKHNINEMVDKQDFILPSRDRKIFPDLKIDVKTQGTKSDNFSKYWYSYIAEKQMEKYSRNNDDVNMFVFTKYVFPQRTCYIIGFISLMDFAENCVYRKKGTVCGGITLSTNDFAIQNLKLKEITSLDRVR